MGFRAWLYGVTGGRLGETGLPAPSLDTSARLDEVTKAVIRARLRVRSTVEARERERDVILLEYGAYEDAPAFVGDCMHILAISSPPVRASQAIRLHDAAPTDD